MLAKPKGQALTTGRLPRILFQNIFSIQYITLYGLKDAESVHTDQHDANVISSAVNSSDNAGQRNNESGDKSYNQSAKWLSENPETSSTIKNNK